MSDTELILQHHKLKRLIQIAVGVALQQQGKRGILTQEPTP